MQVSVIDQTGEDPVSNVLKWTLLVSGVSTRETDWAG
jgi:hypothetical protein